MSYYASGISKIEYMEHLANNAVKGITMDKCASYYGCKHCEHQIILKEARRQDECHANASRGGAGHMLAQLERHDPLRYECTVNMLTQNQKDQLTKIFDEKDISHKCFVLLKYAIFGWEFTAPAPGAYGITHNDDKFGSPFNQTCLLGAGLLGKLGEHNKKQWEPLSSLIEKLFNLSENERISLAKGFDGYPCTDPIIEVDLELFNFGKRIRTIVCL